MHILICGIYVLIPCLLVFAYRNTKLALCNVEGLLLGDGEVPLGLAFGYTRYALRLSIDLTSHKQYNLHGLTRVVAILFTRAVSE